jgi:hypothetical protein
MNEVLDPLTERLTLCLVVEYRQYVQYIEVQAFSNASSWYRGILVGIHDRMQQWWLAATYPDPRSSSVPSFSVVRSDSSDIHHIVMSIHH